MSDPHPEEIRLSNALVYPVASDGRVEFGSPQRISGRYRQLGVMGAHLIVGDFERSDGAPHLVPYAPWVRPILN